MYDFSLLGNARLPTESSTPSSFMNFIMASYWEIACASLSASGCTPWTSSINTAVFFESAQPLLTPALSITVVSALENRY
jgi:hypothetical protein